MPDPGPAFPPMNAAAWRERVNVALKGGSFESLISSTLEGLKIEPLYRRAAARDRALRQKPGAWAISQRMDHPDIALANEIALTDLENGAGALTLCVAKAESGRGFGLDIASEDDLDAALRGVELDVISIRLDAGARASETAHWFSLLAVKRRLTAAALNVDFGLDPIGACARSGTGIEAFGQIARLRGTLRGSGFCGHLMLADGRPYHEAGAGEAQELAAVLGTGVAYLRRLEADGASLDEARDEIAFLLAADADEFLTLAKFRALRRLWARVEAACGLQPKPIRLHAETAFRMMTRQDPWVNICRATMAVFAAGLGGADVITALPFSLALGLPDDFARRIARNTQLLLLEEAHLAKVADAAAGSGAFESLTDQLCKNAWALFQSFERAGGMVESLKAGLPQAEIAKTALKRREAIARRVLSITGVSIFPNLAETPVRVLAPAPALSLEAASPPHGDCTPLSTHRDAEPFELLRAASDAAFERTGARPRLFLVNLDSTEALLPHATFAANLFEAAGIEILSNPSFESAVETAEAFALSKCKIACICASDAALTEAAVNALRLAGAAAIYVAAPPGKMEFTLRDAGVAGFVYANADATGIVEKAIAAIL
jgi:methylmalonyl-CoA mutase